MNIIANGISTNAYANDYIVGIVLPSTLKDIGGFTFAECTSITSVTIPDGVTTIGSYAFRATSITSIRIPASVTSIGAGAFNECASLSEVEFKADGITLTGDVFPTATVRLETAYTAGGAGTYILDTTTSSWVKK
jgi:hypothetical protein